MSLTFLETVPWFSFFFVVFSTLLLLTYKLSVSDSLSCWSGGRREVCIFSVYTCLFSIYVCV